ncbi:MAG TPA: hypothetical protein VGP46_09750 [Acidimicrobiales bacterium]|jgi:hypothetical protein|nr:hypothetical protein [Acidimicrobiales bacterium]
MTLPLVVVWLFAGWISPGMREHEEEFRQAWVQRFGENAGGAPGAVPKQTYKTWYKQFKKTGIGPTDWLAALQQGPPGGSII